MRKITEVFLLVLATILMFAFPVLLLGLTPWLGEGLLALTHFHFSHGLWPAIMAIGMVLGSSAGLMLLAVPVFGGVIWGLGKAIRAQAEPLPARSAAARLTAREQDDEAKVQIPHPSRPMGTLRDLASASAAAPASAGPGLPKLRSKRISTVYRNGEEITPNRDR